MYKIEQKPYGCKISISKSMNIEEAEKFKLELIETLSSKNGPFSLVIDVQRQVPFKPEVAEKIVEIHAACLMMSCERTAIIIKSPVIKGQAAQICLSASNRKCDRIIDATKVSDWEDKAEAWAANADDPDKSPACESDQILSYPVD